MEIPKVSGATIPYQLRPHKAIERNLFIELLKKIQSSNVFDLKTYKYVGFGAAFLEDFKLMHLELGITEMDCIEIDSFAFTRQKFNNPFNFANTLNVSSTRYITDHFAEGKRQIIWLDYAKPGDLRQQLADTEIICQKLSRYDVLKLTFNCKRRSFISSHHIKNQKVLINELDFKAILKFLRDDPTYNKYLPEHTTISHVNDFSSLIRSMAVRAVNRGLTSGRRNYNFHQLAVYDYADGQEMTTITGVFCDESELLALLNDSRISKWEFYTPKKESEFIKAVEISVPAMTVAERIEIDKQIPSSNVQKLAEGLPFFYGSKEAEHVHLINGYHKFYKYLPYYSKVTY